MAKFFDKNSENLNQGFDAKKYIILCVLIVRLHVCGFFVFITAKCGSVGIANDILWARGCGHSWCDFRLHKEVQGDRGGFSYPGCLLYYLVYRGKLNNL